jgi:hypothetical protein
LRSLGNYSLESEWSPKMDASDEGARERPRGHPNAVFSCQFSPQPSPLQKPDKPDKSHVIH